VYADAGMIAAQRLWLCVPPVAACFADVAATLVGQSRGYWSGDRATVTEFNPLARVLLQFHPVAFVVAAFASSALVATAIFVVNRRLAVAIAFVVTFCHAAAAAAWAARGAFFGVSAAVALLVGAERLVALSWRRARLTGQPLSRGKLPPRYQKSSSASGATASRANESQALSDSASPPAATSRSRTALFGFFRIG
jgi:hypothetical protein